MKRQHQNPTLSRRKNLELDVRACVALDTARRFCHDRLNLKAVSDSTLIRYAVGELLAEEVAAIQADGDEDDRLALRAEIEQASTCRDVPQPPTPEDEARAAKLNRFMELTEAKADAMWRGDDPEVERIHEEIVKLNLSAVFQPRPAGYVDGGDDDEEPWRDSRFDTRFLD